MCSRVVTSLFAATIDSLTVVVACGATTYTINLRLVPSLYAVASSRMRDAACGACRIRACAMPALRHDPPIIEEANTLRGGVLCVRGVMSLVWIFSFQTSRHFNALYSCNMTVALSNKYCIAFDLSVVTAAPQCLSVCVASDRRHNHIALYDKPLTRDMLTRGRAGDGGSCAVAPHPRMHPDGAPCNAANAVVARNCQGCRCTRGCNRTAHAMRVLTRDAPLVHHRLERLRHDVVQHKIPVRLLVHLSDDRAAPRHTRPNETHARPLRRREARSGQVQRLRACFSRTKRGAAIARGVKAWRVGRESPGRLCVKGVQRCSCGDQGAHVVAPYNIKPEDHLVATSNGHAKQVSGIEFAPERAVGAWQRVVRKLRRHLLHACRGGKHTFVALVEDDVRGLIEALEHADDIATVVGDDLDDLVNIALHHGRHGEIRTQSRAIRVIRGAARAAVTRTAAYGAPLPSSAAAARLPRGKATQSGGASLRRP